MVTLKEFKKAIKELFCASDNWGMTSVNVKDIRKGKEWPYDSVYSDPKNTTAVQRARTVQPHIPALEAKTRAKLGQYHGDGSGIPWSVNRANKGGYYGDKPVSSWSNYRDFTKHTADPDVYGTAWDDDELEEEVMSPKDWKMGLQKMRNQKDGEFKF